MTLRLTPEQAAYLKAATLSPTQPNKIRLALRLLEGNNDALATALGFKYQQLNRYAAGEDLLLSTAFRIASQLGVSVCDLWPHPPQAKAHRQSSTKSTGKKFARKASRARGVRAEAA